MRWVVAILAIFSGTAVVGQNLKGSKSVGAAFSVSYQKDDDLFKAWNVFVNPLVTRYYSDVSAAGVGLLYQYSRRRFSLGSSSTLEANHQISIYPFWRHHYVVTEKAGAYIRMEAGFGYSHPSETEDIYDLRVGARSGLYYFLTDRWCMEFNWGYANLSHKIRHTSEGNFISDNANINLASSSINVAVQYFFLKK